MKAITTQHLPYSSPTRFVLKAGTNVSFDSLFLNFDFLHLCQHSPFIVPGIHSLSCISSTLLLSHRYAVILPVDFVRFSPSSAVTFCRTLCSLNLNMAFLPALVSTSSLADPFVANTSPSQLQCQTTWILPQISRPHSPPGTVSGDASPSSSKRSIRRYKSREVDSYEKDLDVTIDDLLDHESTSPSSSSSFPPSTLSSGHSLEAGQLFSCINLGDDKASSASDFDYCTASPVFDSTLLAQMMYHFQIAQDIYPASAVLFLGSQSQSSSAATSPANLHQTFQLTLPTSSSVWKSTTSATHTVRMPSKSIDTTPSNTSSHTLTCSSRWVHFLMHSPASSY